MYEFFRKYWWAFAFIGLMTIFFVLPKFGVELFAMHPPVTFVAGDCYQGFCLTACWAKTDVRPYWCSAEGKCKVDADCKALADAGSLKINIEVQTEGSSNTPIVNAAGEVADASEISCKDNKFLYKGSKLWDECVDKASGQSLGCTVIVGKAVCKTAPSAGSSITSFFSDESIKGLPNYLLVLAAVFVLLMFGVAGRK